MKILKIDSMIYEFYWVFRFIESAKLYNYKKPFKYLTKYLKKSFCLNDSVQNDSVKSRYNKIRKMFYISGYELNNIGIRENRIQEYGLIIKNKI
jgi:hypothetical protein